HVFGEIAEHAHRALHVFVALVAERDAVPLPVLDHARGEHEAEEAEYARVEPRDHRKRHGPQPRAGSLAATEGRAATRWNHASSDGALGSAACPSGMAFT